MLNVSVDMIYISSASNLRSKTDFFFFLTTQIRLFKQSLLTTAMHAFSCL